MSPGLTVLDSGTKIASLTGIYVDRKNMSTCLHSKAPFQIPPPITSNVSRLTASIAPLTKLRAVLFQLLHYSTSEQLVLGDHHPWSLRATRKLEPDTNQIQPKIKQRNNRWDCHTCVDADHTVFPKVLSLLLPYITVVMPNEPRGLGDLKTRN